MRLIDAEPSEGRIKLHSAIHGDGAYEAFKRIASEFYTNHTYKFVALTLDGEPRPDIVTFTAEFWRAPDGAEAPPPNDPLTLEELREMDGEPVWWEDKYERAGYGIVSISEFDKVIYIVAANRTFVAAAHGEMNRHLGLTLYRRKLEEERRDKQRADRVVVWIF